MPQRPARRRQRLSCLALAVALIAPLSLPAAAAAQSDRPNQRGSGPARDAWLVELRSGVTAGEAAQLMAVVGATVIGELGAVGVRVIELPAAGRDAALEVLSGDARVASVEPDMTAEVSREPSDPQWSRQWGPRTIGAPQAWDLTIGTRRTVIAIVDTGVDPNQPDLRGRVLRGWDFQNNDANPADDMGHGTAVAGVAAAAGNDRIGIAGMCWTCRILPVKVLNRHGSGTHSNVAAGIVWAADHGADVINLSIASPGGSTVLAGAVDYALRKGVVVVAAAGNDGSKRRNYPAALPGVLSVAASNQADALYRWSNHGSWVRLAAPGCAYTTKRGSNWSWWCGTSFATPLVAGTVALVKSLRPRYSRAQLEAAVLGTAVGFRRTALDGRLDAAQALRSASDSPPTAPGDPPPTPRPTPTPTPRPTVSPTPSPTATPQPRNHEWSHRLSQGERRASRTFWLAGHVHVDLTWRGSDSLWLSVVDWRGNRVVRDEDEESVHLELDVRAGYYELTVGLSSAESADFTIWIEQGP